MPRSSRGHGALGAMLALLFVMACANDATPAAASWWVGPDGGEFFDPASGVALRVPPGALRETVQARVEVVSPETVARDAGSPALAAVRLLPDGVRFEAPVWVTLPLPRSFEPGRPLAPLVFDAAQGLWVHDVSEALRPSAARVLEDGRRAEVMLWHFSGHAVGETFEWDTIGDPVNGLQHVCHVTHAFSVWEGPPITGWWARYGDDGFRRGVFADVFEALILRSDLETLEANVGAVDRVFDALEVGEDAIGLSVFSTRMLAAVRSAAGTLSGAGPTYNRTTFRNVAGALDRFTESLSRIDRVAFLRSYLTGRAARALLLFTLSEGVEDSRIESMRDAVRRAGLLNDTAVAEGLEESIRRVRSRRDAANRTLGQLLALGHALVEVDALVEAGLFFAQEAVSFLRSYLALTSLAAARIAVATGIALEALSGNYRIHRRQSELCALATIYRNLAPLSADDRAADELFTVTYGTLAVKAAARLRDTDLGTFVELARSLGTGIGRAIRWLLGAGPGYTAEFWDGEVGRARAVLRLYQTEVFQDLRPVEPPGVSPPPESTASGEVLSEGGASILEWPFEAPTWTETVGSTFHRCSDLHARDMNTTLGGGDTEIRLGPMYVRAPIAGVVRFAGSSSYDPGRGHQVLIESERVPGFFVSLAHLQPFDAAALLGRRVAAREPLRVAVGNSGTTYAHLHIVAYQRVQSGEPRARMLRGQSPEGYTCERSPHAAIFTLRTPPLPTSGGHPAMDGGAGGVREVGVDALIVDRASDGVPPDGGLVDAWGDFTGTEDAPPAAADAPPAALDTPVPCGGPHRMVCGAACVDTWSDPAHCGRCGSRCASTQRCELGACVASDPCAGLSCPTCQLCRSGRCEAVADLTACGAGRECVAGVCVAACATNYCQAARYDTGAWCDGRAVVRCATSGRCRVETSRVACPTDCVAGACTPCPANLADCDGVPANGCEADLRVSTAHCGSCGVACPGGRSCRGGVCEGSAARLALGVSHTCALTTLGTAQCWGDNVDGALGNGAVFPRRDELTPVGVLDLADATDLAAGRFFSCAVRSGGAAVCWGNNGSGQLGTGASGAPMSHFGDVAALRNARQVSAGWDHACVATTADTAVCWGLNLDGRLGDGTTTTRPAPVAVAGLTGVARVEAGPMHTCALRRDGTVACWGLGTLGRLGNGGTADQLRPAAMVGVTGATGVACARYATCVLRGDGTAACTGGNDNGELGDGGTAGRTVAAPVPGLVDVLRLVAGTTHFCALHRGGSVWCWGRNQEGQLGDGTTADRRVPTRVTGLIDAIEIDAGGDHTCALRPGGRVVCWGANAEGQIGDGTTTARATPTAVVVR